MPDERRTGQITPPPPPGSTEALAQEVFSERATTYVTSETHADPETLARVVHLTSPRPTDRALDIGAGTGHTAFALARGVQSVVALDLTAAMLAEAERVMAERAITNVTLQVGDAHALPFPDASFDIVTCRRAAHHFSDLRTALSEMRRVLAGGGRLVIDDRSVPEDAGIDRIMNHLDHLHDRSHVREYRPSEWLRLLETAGFGVYAIEPYVQHRPLRSLTDGIPEADRVQANRIIKGLSPRQKRTMAVHTINGEVHTNHWYVILMARAM